MIVTFVKEIKMLEVMPVLQKDFYKTGHRAQYPDNTVLVYSNFTPRSSRVEGVDFVVPFGYQFFVKDYLIDQFNRNFFQKDRDHVVKAYKRRVDNALGPGTDVSHIGELHELGFLPLRVKAVPEGCVLPLRVPALTVRNTDDKFYWLTNMIETIMSSSLWMASTSATTAFRYRRVFEEYARQTGADPGFVQWQGHDFSMRGLDPWSSMVSGAAHLLSFTGTDTIPAIDFLEYYYGADSDKELIGGSVPATEHSVMCMGLQAGELGTIRRLIVKIYPSGIVSIVSDTWDFWKVVTDYLPRLRDEILNRDGKVVIRPDSGDPVKIICGDPDYPSYTPQGKGAIQCLWEVFGGTTTSKGYKVLDGHIGLIYGDSITPERQLAILGGLAAKGFASSNVVLGVGSYTYQYVTRDTYGWAMKATYGELLDDRSCTTHYGGVICDKGTKGCAKVHRVGQNIFKQPATDDGTKNSAKGLLNVSYNDMGKLRLIQEVSWAKESDGVLRDIFWNGSPYNVETLATIRTRLAGYL
jgi:nicotinamide phosphoribosyltransferase